MLKILQNLKILDGVLAIGILLIAVGVGWSIKDQYSQNNKVEVISKVSGVGVSIDTQVSNKVMIDISGEVIRPGVYEFKKGDRIADVLERAGGLSLKADRQWVEKNLNRAETVIDGQKIYIPKVSENMETKANTSVVKNNKISLNNGSLSDFDTLPGIGPSIAQKIIDYRTEKGGFKSVEELKLVGGIGDKLYEKIKDQIKL